MIVRKYCTHDPIDDDCSDDLIAAYSNQEWSTADVESKASAMWNQNFSQHRVIPATSMATQVLREHRGLLLPQLHAITTQQVNAVSEKKPH